MPFPFMTGPSVSPPIVSVRFLAAEKFRVPRCILERVAVSASPIVGRGIHADSVFMVGAIVAYLGP